MESEAMIEMTEACLISLSSKLSFQRQSSKASAVLASVVGWDVSERVVGYGCYTHNDCR